MVLARLLVATVLLAGCGQSLFDANGDDSPVDAGGDGSVPSSCPAGCIADAAGDFDGTPTGTRGVWRYLDDYRNRTWAPMTVGTDEMTGADPANTIGRCVANDTSPACVALPGALLVSSAGSAAGADPALELTVAAQQVIQLTFRVHVPPGSVPQIVRLYRSSREDALVTATAMPGVTLDHTLEVDALAGDRFLVAIAPGALGATDIGVHVFANVTGATFPSTCQMAVTFASATGNTVVNPCGVGGDLTHHNYDNANMETPPVLVAGPFPELGMAANVNPGHYFRAASPMPRPGDLTIQMWVHHDAFLPPYGAFPFSDEDLDAGGGLSLVIYDDSGASKIAMATIKSVAPIDVDQANAAWPASGWHFVRISRAGTRVSMCIDGAMVGSFTPTTGEVVSTYAPRFGRNVVWTPQGGFFDGQLDDIRMFSTALPCE